MEIGTCNYRCMDNPLRNNVRRVPCGEAPLQLLYPGRHMSSSSFVSWYDIPHIHPEAERRSWEANQRRMQYYNRCLNQSTRRSGGGDSRKLVYKPFVDPDNMIEDPQMYDSEIDYLPMPDLGDRMTKKL